MKFTGSLRMFFVLAAALLVFAPTAPAGEPKVAYDRETDRLSVTADETSLTGLLKHISLASGVGILIDPAVERNITISIKELPLDTGLKRIARGHSYAMVYDREEGQDSGAPPLLIAMKILPEGKQDNPNLRPVVDPQGEAVVRTMTRPTPDGKARPGIFDHAERRWQARLAKLSPEQREQLLERAREKQAEREQREAEREQKRAESKKRQEERRAERLAREEQLKAENPELYELRQQRRLAREQQLKVADPERSEAIRQRQQKVDQLIQQQKAQQQAE